MTASIGENHEKIVNIPFIHHVYDVRLHLLKKHMSEKKIMLKIKQTDLKI